MPGDFHIQKASVVKVDANLGLVFGWGIVCTENGVDHYDLQGDHIPDDVMLTGTSDFMEHSGVAKEMHKGEQVGRIMHSFPLTADIAKEMEIVSKKTGWMVAMKPGAAALAKFVSGEYRGFSIGGDCAYVEVPA